MEKSQNSFKLLGGILDDDEEIFKDDLDDFEDDLDEDDDLPYTTENDDENDFDDEE